MKLTFAGASDDLIEITGPDGADEFNVHGPGQIMWSADVVDPDGSPVIRVLVLLLDDNGCWHVAAGQVDEDTPMPDWPISIRQDPTCSYAAELQIDAPDGCTLAIHAEASR